MAASVLCTWHYIIISSITTGHEEETKSWETQAAEYSTEEETWQLDRTARAHAEKVEVELLLLLLAEISMSINYPCCG